MFKLKERIVGSKAVGTEAVIIVDTKTKVEVDDPNEIKRVALDYCSDLLTNRQPKPGFEEDILAKEFIHTIRMNYRSCDDSNLEELTEDRFLKTYNIFNLC